MNLESIQTPNAPTPAGHYSQAIVHNGGAIVPVKELHYGFLIEIDAIAAVNS